MTVTLTNNLPTALLSIAAVATGDYVVNNSGVTGACGTSVAAGGHCSIGVTFTPSITGTRASSLSITDGATNSPQVVSLTGVGVTPTTVSATSLSFGNVGLGLNSTTSVTLTNNLPTAISIGIPSATGDFAVNTSVSGYCGATLAAGAHCSIGVTLTPTQLGTRTGILTITDSAGNSTVSLTGTGTTSSITSLTLSPLLPNVILNSTLQFTAIANFPGGITLNATSLSTWSSSSTTFATINSQGLANAIKQGTSTIKVTYAGKSVSTTLTVIIPQKPVINWPTPAPITFGTALSSTQLNAVATYNGVPVAGTYLYYPPAGDTPNFTPDGTNLAVQFTPTDSVHYLPTTGSVVLVVNRATIPVTLSGMTVPYTAGPQSPIVSTSMGAPFVITFNGLGPWPVNVGSYQVLATVNWTNYQGSATGTFTITNATPVFSGLSSQSIFTGTNSINVSGSIAAGTAIPAGEQVAISLSGGTPTLATIGANGGFSATLDTSTLTLSGSPYTITYHYGGDNNPFNAAVDAGTSLTLKAPTLVSIALSPQNSAISLNGTQQFGATGTYSNNTIQNLTGTATWSFQGNSPPSASAVTSVSAGGNATAATTGCGGPVTITATSGSVSGSTTLMVGVPGGFACGTNTSLAREGQTATLLNNGLILIAGGRGTSGVLNTAELYDPAANTTTSAGAMNTSRSGHTATLLQNGKVLLVGGVGSDGSPLNSFEIYDPAHGFQGTIASQGFMVQARQNHTATLLNDGTVLVAGGKGSDGGDLGTFEIYDPGLTGFNSSGALAIARNSHTATVLNTGDVLIAGGYSGGVSTNSSEVFSPSCNCSAQKFIQIPLTSCAVTSNVAILTTANQNLVAGDVVTIGGFTDGICAPLLNGQVLTVIANDLSANQFDADFTHDDVAVQSATGVAVGGAITMTSARAQQAATALGSGLVLLTGGVDGSGNASNTAETYDPGSGSFTAVSMNMACTRANHTATELTNGTVLLAGGCSDTSNSAEVFDPTGPTFTGTPLLTPRAYHTANLVHCACPEDGWILLEDGVGSTPAILNSTEWYQPTDLKGGLTSIQVSPTPGSISLGTMVQFTATGTIGSGSQPLNAVTWTTSDPTVLTISNDATNSGLALPVNAGTATVKACAGSVCGSTTVTVN